MRRLKIIVAEDEEDIRLYFQELLEHHGHEVAGVADGPALVELCRSGFRPDVLLVDWRLGGSNGLEAVAEVNRDASVPVVLVTGSDLGGLPPLGDHVVAVLSKPVNPGDLKAAVERAASGAGVTSNP